MYEIMIIIIFLYIIIDNIYFSNQFCSEKLFMTDKITDGINNNKVIYDWAGTELVFDSNLLNTYVKNKNSVIHVFDPTDFTNHNNYKLYYGGSCVNDILNKIYISAGIK
jgi:hypothetical protein